MYLLCFKIPEPKCPIQKIPRWNILGEEKSTNAILLFNAASLQAIQGEVTTDISITNISSAMLLEVAKLYYFCALKSQCLWSFLELSFFVFIIFCPGIFSVHRKFVHEFCFCFTEFTVTSV